MDTPSYRKPTHPWYVIVDDRQVPLGRYPGDHPPR